MKTISKKQQLINVLWAVQSEIGQLNKTELIDILISQLTQKQLISALKHSERFVSDLNLKQEVKEIVESRAVN